MDINSSLYWFLLQLFRRFDLAVDPVEPFRGANHGLRAHFGVNMRIMKREAAGNVGVFSLYHDIGGNGFPGFIDVFLCRIEIIYYIRTADVR